LAGSAFHPISGKRGKWIFPDISSFPLPIPLVRPINNFHSVLTLRLPSGAAAMKLTSADHALPPGKADAILFDDELIGFGLRLRRGSGGKLIRNWVVQYRAHGRSRRIVVGAVEKVSAAEARQQARKLLAAVALGGDPQAEKAARRDRDVLSFRRVAEDFIAVKTGIKPRSLGLLRLYLVGGPYLKPLHPVPIDKVTRKDIAARLLAVAKASGAPTSVQVHSAVSNLMTWAMQMGFIEANPIVGAFKPKRAPGR
jgi:hypothetical protein